MSATILIVEDEKRIAEWVQRYLENDGFKTIMAHDGATGLELAHEKSPDLVVLDLMLPGIDGIEVAKRLRTDSNVPIIMLTARDTQQDRVKGLELGADDYIVKPFDPEELVARVKAVLRRSQTSSESKLIVGDFELRVDEQRVFFRGELIELTAQQFAILSVFIKNPSRLVTRDQLIQGAFSDFEGFDRAIDAHIRRLRIQIEPDASNPQYLKTVYGAGYRFVPE